MTRDIYTKLLSSLDVLLSNHVIKVSVESIIIYDLKLIAYLLLIKHLYLITRKINGMSNAVWI